LFQLFDFEIQLLVTVHTVLLLSAW